MKTKVKKALSDEERQLVASALSALQQLAQGEAGEEELAEMSEKEEEEEKYDKQEEEEDEKEEKAEGEGGTASDDAETRIDEANTELTEESLGEVEKGIENLLNEINRKPVKKSANPEYAKVLGKLTAIIQKMFERQNSTDTAIENILNGLGVAKEVKKTYEPKQPKNITPRDSDLVVKALIEHLQGVASKKEEPASYRTSLGGRDSDEIRKGLGEAMQFAAQHRAKTDLERTQGRF